LKEVAGDEKPDSEFVLRLAEDLRAAGANVWLDQLDIEPGHRWARAVEAALSSCQRVLVILSSSSVESSNVQDEITFALEEKKIVIPILYRDCRILLQLRGLQYVDFRTDYDCGLKRLLKTLRPDQRMAGGSASSSGDISQRADPTRQAELQRRKQANENVAKMKEQWRRRREREAAPLKYKPVPKSELRRRNENVAKMKEQWRRRREREAASGG
jgi:hypothetical protein